MDSDGRRIIKSAFDNLKQAVSSNDLIDFERTTLEDVVNAAREIEREQSARNSLRNMRRIEPALRSLESQHINVLEHVLKAYKDISEALPRIEILRAAFANDADFQRVLGYIYSDLLEFHHQAYKFFRHRAWHFCFTFHWGLFERRFKCILASLGSHFKVADKQASALHFLEMKKKRELERLENDEYERHRRQEMTKDVFGWLSADDDQQEDFLCDLAETRRPGTCNWILAHEQVVPWLQEEKGYPLIWMTGKPGAGKTVLCSLVIQHLQTSESRSTLYYFCSQGDKSDKGCARALRTLAVQLLRQNIDLAPLVHQKYLQEGSNFSIPSLKKILIALLSGAKNVYIVLDGVDECDEKLQKNVLTSVVELQKHCLDSCKVLVSSRDEPLIRKILRQGICLSLKENTDEALRCYIQYKLGCLHETFPDLDARIAQRIEDRLNAMANGMFLWVHLVTIMLEDLATEHELDTYIETLPDGLDKAYDRITARIDNLSKPLRERALRILYWTCAALRPVKLEEVVDGISLKPGQATLSKATRAQDPQRDVLDLCAPLLQTRQGLLEMVHFTAKEYLLSDKSGPFIPRGLAHLNISISCLLSVASSLLLVPRYSGSTSQQDLENLVVKGAFGLQGYVHENWVDHVMAYFATTEQPEDSLVACLNDFYKVRKDFSTIPTSLGFAQVGSESSRRMARFPKLIVLVQDWLKFRKELAEQTFASVNAQQIWQRDKDSTYLSLIEQKILSITEDICAKSATQIPEHINKQDFTVFKARLGSTAFICRYFMCSHVFATVRERNTHEITHLPSFPCLDCDFTGRGFRSARDLERHKSKYHMSAQDFEIPSNVMDVVDLPLRSKRSLEEADINTSVAKRVAMDRCRWTTKGFQALRNSLTQAHQALADARHQFAKVALEEQGSVLPVQKLPNQETSPSQEAVMVKESDSLQILNAMKERIEHQGYQSFQEFGSDVCSLAETMQSQWRIGNSNDSLDAMSLCAEALKRPLKDFPNFANLELPEAVGCNNPSSQIISLALSRSRGGNLLHGEETADSAEGPWIRKPVYWSSTEEVEFPRLLEHYGHDFESIANFFQTKTVNDVRQRYQTLVESGKVQALEGQHPSGPSITALSSERDPIQSDERLMFEGANFGTPAMPGVCQAEPEDVQPVANALLGPLVALSSYKNMDSDSQISLTIGTQHVMTLSSGEKITDLVAIANDLHSPDHSPHITPRPQEAQITVADGASRMDWTEEAQVAGPKKYQRRPPHRVTCSHCGKSLHSDHVLGRHIARRHSTTENDWICQDVSPIKNFLSRCKACVGGKRYKSRAHAMSHLRKCHFKESTPIQDLTRWTAETEEAAHAELHLPPENDDTATPMGKLPRILCLAPSDEMSSASSPAASEPLPDHKEGLLLRNVSFDEILSDGITSFKGKESLGPHYLAPLSIDHSLITVGQVERLFFLHPLRRAACKDQVQRLHEILATSKPTTAKYKQAHADLQAVSLALLEEIRSHRRTASHAPELPIML